MLSWSVLSLGLRFLFYRRKGWASVGLFISKNLECLHKAAFFFLLSFLFCIGVKSVNNVVIVSGE